MDFSMIFCYIIGALFAYLGIYTLIRSLHDKKVCTTEIKAKIVEYEIRKSAGGPDRVAEDNYFPIFSYNAEGLDVKKAGNIGYTYEKYPVGTEMIVLYEQGNPENFIVPSNKKSSYFISMVLALMGIVLIVITILRQLGIIIM